MTAPTSAPADHTAAIARSAGTVSFAVMCSRVLGLVREQVFASLFGAGYAYDAFVVAFRIPNLLRDLFAEGALSAAFVTVFTDSRTNRGEAATWRLAANVLSTLTIVLSVITLAGMLTAHSIVGLLAPDFAAVAGKAELTARLTVIMFPFLIFVSLAAAVMGMLNTHGRFFVPAMASSFFNLGSIVGGVVLALALPHFGQPAIVGMACGTLIGGALQLAVQLPALRSIGFSFRPLVDVKDAGLRRVFFLMGPAVVGMSATQINIFINTGFAASCAEGSVSWLNYAFRFVQFPIGLFGVALSIACLPVVSRQAASGNLREMRATVASSLTMVALLTMPATVGLLFLAEHIVRVIYEHGAFTALDTAQTAQALRFYSLGLVAYAAVKVLVPVFYALGSTRYPVLGSFLAVGANIGIILLAIGNLQHRAIALATSCAMTANFLFLYAILSRKLGGIPWRTLAGNLFKISAACLVMSFFLFFFDAALKDWLRQGLLQSLTGLAFLVASGALVYLTVLRFLGVDEYDVVCDRFRSRLLRGRKK